MKNAVLALLTFFLITTAHAEDAKKKAEEVPQAEGRRIVFLVDGSGSMLKTIPGGEKTYYVYAWERIKLMLAAMKPKQSFALGVFQQGMNYWWDLGQDHKATPERIQEAIQFIDDRLMHPIRLGGSEGCAVALDLMYQQNRIDSVYLFTDADFSAADSQAVYDVADENGIHVNIWLLGPFQNVAYARALTRQTGGGLFYDSMTTLKQGTCY